MPALPLPLPSDAPIGVFDSGVGGLSVLRHIRAQLPQEHLLYFADSGFAPYGDKAESIIVERSLKIAAFLLGCGAKALVVACNTATAAAIQALRTRYPGLLLVGVEPGLKPAAALTRTGKVGVLATEGTLTGEKFLALRAQISGVSQTVFFLQSCVGLADQIELGQLGEHQEDATSILLQRHIVPLLEQGVDTLVLGCTHYPFVRPAIERIIAQHSAREIMLIDTGEAVARQLARLMANAGLLRHNPASPRLQGYTSAHSAALMLAFAALLGWQPMVEEIHFSEQIENKV